MEIKTKHITGDAWEVSLPYRVNAISSLPPLRPRRIVHAPDEASAIAAGEDVFAREYPAYLKGTTLELGELVYYYLEHAQKAGLYTPETAHDYKLIAKRYIDPNFAKQADEVLPVDIEELYAFLMKSGGENGQGVSANTVRKLHTILTHAFEFLVREGIVESTPMPAVHAPKYQKVRRRALTERELGKVVTKLEEAVAAETNIVRRNALFGALLDLKLGVRVAEMCAVTRGDINFIRNKITIDKQISERGGIHVKSKTKGNHGKPRSIKIGKKTIPEIKAHMEWQKSYLTKAQRDSERTPLCTNSKGGFMRPRVMSNIFKEFCLSIGVELTKGESFHLLRHTNASELLGKGSSLVDVQTRLGHARGSMTIDNYGHEVESESELSGDRIDEAIDEIREEELAW